MTCEVTGACPPGEGAGYMAAVGTYTSSGQKHGGGSAGGLPSLRLSVQPAVGRSSACRDGGEESHYITSPIVF